ncbi:related to G2/mitotic-specific cyclin 3 [Phialocephala subalpina]|uniref:Related to G2/mitotic-specific cyclin 3 n=1 Tax=Phialocephala subalpina TaxID=576137 RepID=A0A1L7XJ91_9HELO|nr:related to G2/mitotic-specific cyclin 3 [Phialocephala subalpina]
MDARPQRPLRATRAHNDENSAPESNQVTHTRNKSLGGLANMIPNALKAPAKRTAFGDVSNTARVLNTTSHDDSANAGKKTIDIVKPVLQTKPSGLLRPAQRPATATSAQAPALLASHYNPSSDPISASIAAKVESKPLAPPPKRALSKRATSIYKDTDVENAYRQDAAPIAPVHQNLGPRQHRSQPQLKQEQPVIRRTQSKVINTNHSNSLEAPAQSDPIYEDAKEQQLAEFDEGIPASIKEDQQHGPREIVVETGLDLQRRALPPTPRLPEPEEYWEEEEEEVYDEQGYTTAHSYRSRGDNTTGGATTVLFPKVTRKAERELAAAKELVEGARTMEEIEDEAWDTSMVAEYGDEIFAYMRELEIKMLPNAHYMDNQTEIQWSMRSVLMDWLIQVHCRFSLLPETLFLCVNYIDRFLSCKIVSLGKLQLVGATAIFVAAKYEEINCPSVNEIVYMVDGGYTVDEVLKAERFMLSMLSFELGWPGPMSFLRRISKADDYDLETRTLAKYFLEVTIMDERFVGSPPSYVAAGAHCFARMMLKKGDWSPAHVYYSGYTWTQLRPLVAMMLECCENPEKHHQAVFDKYSDRRYKRASLFVQAEMAKGFVLPMPAYNYRPSLPSLEDVAAHMPFETRDSFQGWAKVNA